LGSTLLFKDKTIYNVTLINIENNNIMFKAILSRNWFKKLSVNINDNQQLKLSNGTMVIENRIISATDEEQKKSSYDRHLSFFILENYKRA